MKLIKPIAFNDLKNKIIATLIVALLVCNMAAAAVSTYTFATSSGTYTAITGTTLIASTTTTRWDDEASSLQTIPFSFTYNGNAYTTLGVNSNGYVVMGAVSTATTNYCGAQGSEANVIAAYATDLVGGSLATTSNISVATRSTAPNRQYVIQWNDCSHWTNAAYTDHWSFQIILNETSNTVQIVWGNSTNVTTMGANVCADAATESGSVGLIGAANTDFNLRSVTNGTNTWATSVAGTAINAVCNMSSTNIPANGLTYTWTPAAPVAMTYTSSTTSFLNNSVGIPRNSTNNQIIQIQITTAGSLSPLSITSLVLSTSGCTNASADISNAKIYYTALNTTFATTTQFGTTVTNPNGSFTINGTATLAEGVNNFWLVYDIKSTANYGDVLSACCTQINGSTGIGSVTPTVTCPAGSQIVYQTGTWTPIAATAPHPNKGHMLLLSDGTVICKSSFGGTDGHGNVWDKLTPDINGSYVNGTWSSIAPMINTRLFFSSQVLKDGRVYVAGGEYGTGLAAGEVYDPLQNTWTLTGAPGANISDANSEILEDGRVLQAIVAGALTGTKIYNPATNVFTTGPTARGIHNESAWLKLPDNSILYVDRLSTSSERYIPATNTWIADGVVPVSLYDPYGDETGAAFLLPDGRAFFLGALGHTAYYTPSGTTSPGVWTAGPDIPSGKGTPDAAAAMMINGKILCAVSPVPTAANHFPTPTTFYEFDYTSNSFILVNAPGNVASLNIGSFQTNFLDLPDGSVLYAQNQTSSSSQYYIYKPAAAQVSSGKPTINNISQITCDSFSITGNLFNGISQGACYGDDGQMSTNYPIIRLTSGSNVYYARTSYWNSTGVMRGSAADTTQFKLPAGLPAGNYQLVVTANGISSDPINFTANPTLSSVTTASSICSGTAFIYTPTSTRTNATFTWTRGAVAGISNAAITTAQTTNPNEVLVNTTSNAINVVYAYTINAGSCSSTQNVNVVVKNASTSNANILICPSELPYSWNGITFTVAGSQTYHTTNSVGCDSAATLNLTVKSTSTSTTNLSICPSELPYSWNGLTITVAGSQTYHTTNSVGCDSAATLNLTVKSTSTSTTNLSICTSALPYSWNGLIFTVAGSQTYHTTNSVGCDSAATLNLTVKNNYTITASASNNGSISNAGVSSICEGNNVTYNVTANAGYYVSSVLIDGNNIGATTTYTFSNVASNHTIVVNFGSLCTPTSSTTNLIICSHLLPITWNGLTITTAGSQTAHITNIAGCDSAATLNVSFANATSIPAIVTYNSLCVNQTTTATNSLLGGTWSSIAGRATINASGLVTGASAGTATIRYTISSGSCAGFVSKNIVVNAIPATPNISYAPNTPSPQGNGGYCKNRTFTLIGSPSGGAWTSTGVISVTNAGVVSTGNILGSGSVNYSITNASGCSSSRSIAGNIVACATKGLTVNGQKSIFDNQLWTIYPNPTHSIINLNVKTLVCTGSIVVTDLYGKQLKTQTLSMGTNTIDVSSFARGVYLLSIITEQGKQTQKVIVE